MDIPPVFIERRGGRYYVFIPATGKPNEIVVTFMPSGRKLQAEVDRDVEAVWYPSDKCMVQVAPDHKERIAVYCIQDNRVVKAYSSEIMDYSEVEKVLKKYNALPQHRF